MVRIYDLSMEDSPDGHVDDDYTKAALFFGDLDGSVTENQLSAVSGKVVPVVSVEIITDKLQGTSLGYGFINFNNCVQAAEALDVLNFIPINGNSIRVTFRIKDPSFLKNGYASLFIKDLDASIDNMFAPYGQIISCKVALLRGHAFVQFKHESSSRRAIEHMNGMLQVVPFIPREVRDRARNVFIKNLPGTVTTDELIEMFKVCGTIDSAAVMTDADGRSRGFGFVSFLDHDDAATAIEKFHETVVDERVLYVAWAQRKSERQAELKARYEHEKKRRIEELAGANLYMKNIDDNYDEQKLKALFSEFGSVTSCKVMVDSRGHSKGFGFLAFSTVEEAQHAMNNMNGKILGRKPLYVGVAERKEERRTRMQTFFSLVREQKHPIVPPPMSSMNQQLGAPELARQHMHYGFGFHPPVASRSIHPCVAQNILMPYPFQRQGRPEMYHIQPQFGQCYANIDQGFGYNQHPDSFFVHQPVAPHGLMGPHVLPSPFGRSGMPVQNVGGASRLVPPANSGHFREFGQGYANIDQGFGYNQHPHSFFVHQPVAPHGLMGPPGLPSPSFGRSGMPVQHVVGASRLVPPANSGHFREFGQGYANIDQGFGYNQHPHSFFVHQPETPHGLMGPPVLPSTSGRSGMPVQHVVGASRLVPPANSGHFREPTRPLHPLGDVYMTDYATERLGSLTFNN